MRRSLTLVLLLTIILSAGVSVRLLGIRHGEPRWIWHPDVSKQAVVARAVYAGADDPYPFPADDIKRRLYPYGTAVILGTSLRWAESAGFAAPPPGTFPENDRWLWSLRLRYFAIALWLASTAIAVLLLHPCLGAWPSLFMGLLLSLEPLIARHSHYGMNDVPLAAIMLLVWILSSRGAGGGRGNLLLFAAGGFLLGLGFAVKYQALIGLVFPLLSALLVARGGRKGTALAAAVLFGLFFFAGAALAIPPFREDPVSFLAQWRQFMHWQANIMEGQSSGWMKVPVNILWLIRFLASSGLWVFLPGLLWAAARLRGKKDPPALEALLLSGIAFTILLPAVLIFSRDLMRPSDLLFALPCLFFFSGLLVARRGKGPAMIAAAGIVTLLFALTSIRDGLAFGREDTRLRARRWYSLEIPPGSRVVLDRYVLPVGRESVKEVKQRFLIDEKTTERIAAGRYDFAIASSLAHDRFLDPLSPFSSPEMRERHERVFGGLPVAARFDDRRLPFNHPAVTVYRVPQPDGVSFFPNPR